VPSLFVIQGRSRGTRFELNGTQGAVSIGREAGNFIQLDDNEDVYLKAVAVISHFPIDDQQSAQLNLQQPQQGSSPGTATQQGGFNF
jgi:hypothetical protein